MSTNKNLNSAGKSIVSNILVQLLSKCLTFTSTAITLHWIQSTALLGIINVRLTLLYTTLQFLSREPFRRACLGEAAKCNQNSVWQRIVNTCWLGTLQAVLLSLPLRFLWMLNLPSKDDLAGSSISDYEAAVDLMCISVFVDMLGEACFVYAQAKDLTDHNPKVEMLWVILKTLTTALVTVFHVYNNSPSSNSILTKLGYCQLVASSITVIYSFYRLCKCCKVSPLKFMPSLAIVDSTNQETSTIYRYLDKTCLNLSFGFMSQTLIKQLLTEGERYIMTFFNVISLGEQGVYDVVNNLGSLAARLIFKPIEESGYTLFSKTVSRTKLLNTRKFHRVQENVIFFIKLMILIGLAIFSLGFNFVSLITLYGGSKLNNPTAFTLMRWQLGYTPLLALNGITECFTFAIMDTTQIQKYNLNLIKFSVIFLVTVILTQNILGSACFVLANCLTMGLRIYISYKTISEYFMKHGYNLKLSETLPSLTTVISLTEVFLFLMLVEYFVLDLTKPFTVLLAMFFGGSSFLFIVHVVDCHEESLREFVLKLFKFFR